MSKEEIHSFWAPDASPWSRWAKPVLFSYLDSAVSYLPIADEASDISWVPTADENTAVVVDLPGAESVRTGLALAERGYRPVPLYNAVPIPYSEMMLEPQDSKNVVAVDVFPILAALREGAEKLELINLPVNAPPAFLLDANRQGDGRTMSPGKFDNRSVSFTTDFPSANFLASRQIKRVILVQKDSPQPQGDLAHTLRRWQDGGLILLRMQPNGGGRLASFEVTKPAWYRAMFQRALARFGLRRSKTGGFGAWVPDASAGG